LPNFPTGKKEDKEGLLGKRQEMKKTGREGRK